MFDLRGRTALVTGSNRGIGHAILMTLAQNGANVYIHCRRDVDSARMTRDAARAMGVQAECVFGDLAEENTPAGIASQMAALMGMPDILVLNASYQIRNRWQDIGRADYEYQMQVDFFSSLQLIQLCAPSMLANRWGRIIVIGSVQQAKPHPEMIVYAAAKAAQLSMVENLSLQFAQSGVTVNNVAPGAIYTDRNAQALADEAYHRKVIGDIPAGFIGEPEDCAGAVLLLASQEGRYITGANLYVDGGKHI